MTSRLWAQAYRVWNRPSILGLSGWDHEGRDGGRSRALLGGLSFESHPALGALPVATRPVRPQSRQITILTVPRAFREPQPARLCRQGGRGPLEDSARTGVRHSRGPGGPCGDAWRVG